MTDTVFPPCTSSPGDGAAPGGHEGPPITFVVSSRGATRLVEIAGELDLAGVDQMFEYCTDDQSRDVLVDLTDLTFMDCGGYRAIVSSRAELALNDRTLVLVGATGEPRRLLDLIEEVDTGRSAC